MVTGLGVVSSIGIGKDKFWNNLIAGKSGVSKVESFDTSKYENHMGGEIKDFDPNDFIKKDKIKRLGRGSQFAIAATKLALSDSGVEFEKIDKNRIGAIIGTTMADSQRLEEMDKTWVESSEKDVDAKLIPQYPGSIIASSIGFELGVQNLVYSIPTACSAGNYCIGYSYDMIRTGKADFMLAGGSDSFSRVAFTGFNRLFAVAPEKCQPFDRNRKGMMVGEGSGVLVLESLDSARKRRANIYAEVLGYALSCDAHHMTAPSVEGISRVMKKAIKNADIHSEDVDYISAHGTGTPANDKAECAAVKEVFGDGYKEVPVSSIKSMLGHTMGAASAIEAITCCLAIKEGSIPPTINYETSDPECDIDCVPNIAKKKTVRIALNNSLAFGGNDACLVLGKL
ncbi:MAG: beta-ketoacyl-[acyl-carrier-protein] synthase family protein [Candidatus Omnitrophica bacterium]|nr:beta-ketoacyl-[acyl-carrier-protein] synthase family protein [Candidatus Omnitrophota bacterium]